MDRKFQTKYGYFDKNGKEYVITTPMTPKPWCNVICTGDYGLTLSNAGSGYSWRTNAGINRVTRWDQDIIKDDQGKYFYCRDEQSGKFWSLAYQPVRRQPVSYECRHGIGYSVIASENEGIKSELMVFVPPAEHIEIWKVVLKNNSGKKRMLSVFSYLEWCLGTAPDSHREFHKLFIETEYSAPAQAVLATKRLWCINNDKGQSWNRNWDFCAFHAANVKPVSYETDKEKFLGQFRSMDNPAAMGNPKLSNHAGKFQDGMASLQVPVELNPGQSKEIIFTIGAAETKIEAVRLSKKYHSFGEVKKAWDETQKFWDAFISPLHVQTPDDAFNIMNNYWLKYQSLSARIWGRTAYYQTGGAYGYRDQLQDSQVFLPLAPEYTKKQIKLHAAHQFLDGTTYHWWHPITEEGARKKYNDDLLWLPFVTLNYLKETQDFALLKDRVNYLEENGKKSKKAGSIYEHCRRAIDSFWTRISRRGVPLMGAGDWNDGLSTIGSKLNSESVWLGHFLVGILENWAEMENRRPGGNKKVAAKYAKAAEKMRKSINRNFWDGEWYIRATKDNGKPIGSKKNTDGKIFLNAQTWAIINNIVTPDRLPKVLKSLDKYLFREYGPLLLYPAYSKVDEEIGYLTRYAPGARENGGLYTHAGTWGVWSECVVKRNDKAWQVYKSFCPPYRGMEPDLYQAEPYVTPGNVDGPDSPNFGRGSWTFYTGSSAWYFRIATEYLLGVRPTYDGLLVDPCIPKHWPGYEMKRVYRGTVYNIKVVRSAAGKKEIFLDGKLFDSNIIPAFKDGKEHAVVVRM
ncbi:MAG: glycosyl transferase family 36 [Elusimicrobiota bacterium]